jgi:serine/threonine-protein kinase
MDDSRSAPVTMPRSVSQGPDPRIGRVINDRYRIVGVIARGGMGKVYRAEQQPLGRLVALKILDPHYTGDNDPEFHRRFFLEASIASKLTHPNTVTIFDYGKTDDDTYYIAMELLEGRTLHRALRDEGPFPPERAMHIGRQICRSLREAHALGVIHRDLKPANVYLVQHGDESDFVKVLDFGLVKNVEDKESEEITRAGLFMGSPKYMSPEQIRGEEEVDARVDVYALGVMMYEMLTGKPPFDRPSSVNILMAHIRERVPPMNEQRPDVQVPAALEAVVQRCMEKERTQRYPSMDAVLTALKQCSGLAGTLSGELRLDGADVWLARDPVDAAPLGLGSVGTASHGLGLAPAPFVGDLPSVPAPSRLRKLAPLGFAAVAVGAVVAGFVATRVPASSAGASGRAGEPSSAASAPPASTPGAAAGREAAGPSTPVPPAATAADRTPARANPTVSSVLISLRSTPPGAVVVVGGKEYGPTPTQFEWSGADVAFGREITFRFQRKGYRDLTVTRQIRGDRLDVDAPPMDPIPVRRPSRGERLELPGVRATVPRTSTPAPPLTGYKAEPY